MRSIFVLGQFLVLQTFAIAQCESGWVETIGGVPTGSQASVGSALEVDESGFVYVVSSEYRSDSLLIGDDWVLGAGSANVQNRDFYVTKYSPSGEALWIMYANGDNQDYPKDAALDAEGNLYVTGQFRDTLQFNGDEEIVSAGSQDMFLCKISTDGELEWVHRYGNSVARGVSVVVDENGAYMAGVFFSDSIAVGDSIYQCAPPSGQSDIVVMKHSLDGDLMWSRHITGENSQQVGALSVNNGKIILTGVFLDELVTTEETISGSSTYDYYLLSMTSTDGGVEWIRKSYGGGLSATIEDIAFDSQHNIYLSGRFNTSSISFQSVQTSNSGQYDYFILKISATGDSEWIISSNGDGFEVITGIEMVGNTIVVTGGITQSSFSIGDSVLVNSGDTDVFLGTYNTDNGEGICGRVFSGDGIEQGTAIAILNEHVYVGGAFTGNLILDGLVISPIGNQDLFVWKTCLPCDIEVGVENAEVDADLFVYPNPTTNQLNINLSANQKATAIGMLDMLGREVLHQPFTTRLDVSHLPAGNYVVAVYTEDGVLRERVSVVKNE